MGTIAVIVKQGAAYVSDPRRAAYRFVGLAGGGEMDESDEGDDSDGHEEL